MHALAWANTPAWRLARGVRPTEMVGGSGARCDDARQRWHPILVGVAVALGVLVASAGSGRVAAQPATTPATPWTFSLTPYFWAPSVEATLEYNLAVLPGDAQRADVSIDAGDVLGKLNFGAMLAGEARRGRFAIITDLIYLDLGDEKSAALPADYGQPQATIDARSTLEGFLWGLAGSYTLVEGGWGRVDATAGFRLFVLESRTDIRLNVAPGAAIDRRLEQTATLLDAVVGLRGQFDLGAGFSIPYAFDIGGGSSSLTWQAQGAVTYRLGSADLALGYRVLHYEQGSDKLLRDLTLKGPFAAVSLRF
jgi:hypothetical protein